MSKKPKPVVDLPKVDDEPVLLNPEPEPELTPLCECCVTSCKVKVEGLSEEQLKEQGWKIVVKSTSRPNAENLRTHIGWCKSCAEKFNVE